MLSATAASVGWARRWLADFLEVFAVGTSIAEPIVLVLSELVTNVVLHGDGEAGCQVSMLEHGRCCIAMLDAGHGRPIVVPPGERPVGGLGLLIVQRLSSEWGVAEFPGAKAVWVLFSTTSDDTALERTVAC